MTTTIFWPCNMSEKAGRRIRTDDLLITNQLLYQLSYAGIYEGKLAASFNFAQPLYPQFLPLGLKRYEPQLRSRTTFRFFAVEANRFGQLQTYGGRAWKCPRLRELRPLRFYGRDLR